MPSELKEAPLYGVPETVPETVVPETFETYQWEAHLSSDSYTLDSRPHQDSPQRWMVDKV